MDERPAEQLIKVTVTCQACGSDDEITLALAVRVVDSTCIRIETAKDIVYTPVNNKPATDQEIIEEICKACFVDPLRVTGGGRGRREVTMTRRVIIWVFRSLDYTLQRIGRLLGIDHSSISHAWEKAQDNIDNPRWHKVLSECLDYAQKRRQGLHARLGIYHIDSIL